MSVESHLVDPCVETKGDGNRQTKAELEQEVAQDQEEIGQSKNQGQLEVWSVKEHLSLALLQVASYWNKTRHS